MGVDAMDLPLSLVQVYDIVESRYALMQIAAGEQGPGLFLRGLHLSLIHISEPTRPYSISYARFCLKKKKKK